MMPGTAVESDSVSSDSVSNVTILLNAIRDGETYRVAELFEVVHAELRQMAAGQMRQESGSQRRRSATSLVHESYLRMVGNGVGWESRGHFFKAAATAMRRILIDGAKVHASVKRGGRVKHLELNDVADADAIGEFDHVDMLALDAALRELSQLDPRVEQVVMLRYFTGLTEEETANVLGVSSKTVQRDWDRARNWLLARIEGRSASE